MKINEITTNTTQKDLDWIERHCGPYLQEIGGIDNALIHYPMYRGSDDVFHPHSSILRVTVRQNRRPRSTGVDDHEQADGWFIETFGIPYRSASLFCTGNVDTAAAYARYYSVGNTAIVLPIGEYHYCWSPHVQDLFMGFRGQFDEFPSIVDFLDHTDYYEDTRLINAIASHNEIMLHCKDAALVKRSFVDDLLLQRLGQK